MLVIGPVSFAVTGIVTDPFAPTDAASSTATGAGSSIATVYACAPVTPKASVAVTVTGNVPAAVGVPPSVPDGERVSPAGSAPAVTANVYGAMPPVVAIVVAGYAVPTLPAGRLAGVNAKAGEITVNAYPWVAV